MQRLPGIEEYNACYCCGIDVGDATTVQWFGGAMRIYLCLSCMGAEYVFDDEAYFILRCPEHGDEDIAGMVRYFDALDKFNEKAKEIGSKRKRCKKISRKVKWEEEIEKLRNAYKCMI